MGIMKHFATEDNTQQYHFRKSKTQARRQNALGHYRPTPEAELPLDALLRQVLLRLHRVWIALRFQIHRLTLGAFRERCSVKLGALATICYLLFFSENPLGLFSQASGNESLAVGPVETALEVSDKPRSRSINWNFKPKLQNRQPEAPSTGEPPNNPAPMRAAQMVKPDAERYIARFAKIARQEMQKYGIPASISLAQGLIESRYGTSKLAVQNNNHFGMKCFSKKCRDGHCSNFFDDHHKDFFRKYPNAWESWRAHSQMLAGGRYARLKKHGRNYRKWAYGLESLGYATDRSYAEKLIGVIERYNLHRFD